MNIEFTRPIKIVTAVTQSSHPHYYNSNGYGVHYADNETNTAFKKYTEIATVIPTNPEGDIHSIEFTLPDLGTTGSGSLVIVCDGDPQNTVNINIVPSTGETTPIQINL